MKNLVYFFLALTLILTSSCKKDEECVATDLGTTIVGEWNVSAVGLPAGSVEFNANGTLIDSGNTLTLGEIGGITLDKKTYAVVSNSMFTVRAENSSNPAVFLTYNVDVSSFTCDQMNITVSGYFGTMTRR